MRVFKCTYVLCLLWIITGCSGSKDPYKMMIEHMLTDKTLLDELWCDGCNRITDYSVHDVVNSSVLDRRASCLLELHEYDIITETWDRNRNLIWPKLRRYSTADISDFHVFFNERVMNVQAMIVFFREASDDNPYGFSIEHLYSDPLHNIWRFNTGVLYVFEFDENTGEIESVCREAIQIE
jgi:hypothetical protein